MHARRRPQLPVGERIRSPRPRAVRRTRLPRSSMLHATEMTQRPVPPPFVSFAVAVLELMARALPPSRSRARRALMAAALALMCATFAAA